MIEQSVKRCIYDLYKLEEKLLDDELLIDARSVTVSINTVSWESDLSNSGDSPDERKRVS